MPAGTPMVSSTLEPGTAVPPRVGTFGQLVMMEWVKFRTLRSTVWTLLLAAVCSVGLTAMIAALATGSGSGSGGSGEFTIVETSAFGAHTAQLFTIVLGALIVTAEYTSGSIRTTLAAAAGRGRLMAAKAVVLTLTTFTLGALIAAASWMAARVLLAVPGGGEAGPGAGLGEMGRLVAAGATYPTLVALLAFGLGMTLRSTAAAIALVIGLQAVIPSLFPLLPTAVADRVLPAMPSFAAEVLLTGQAQEGDYGPWAALAVLCAWTLVALVAGYGTLKRRDA